MGILGNGDERVRSGCKTNEKGETSCDIKAKDGSGYIKYVTDADGRKHVLEKVIDARPGSYQDIADKINKILEGN